MARPLKGREARTTSEAATVTAHRAAATTEKKRILGVMGILKQVFFNCELR